MTVSETSLLLIVSTIIATSTVLADSRCKFDTESTARLKLADRCAVEALSATCDDRHLCHARCLISGKVENIGGGCAHFCGLIEGSHAYYDCYPGLRATVEALMINFAIVNESSEKMSVRLHYAIASNHEIQIESECLDIVLYIAPLEQIGKEAFIVDEQRNSLVRLVQPVREGTASQCMAHIDIPPRKTLLHTTFNGYWFSELEMVEVETLSGRYEFAQSDIPKYEPAIESLFRWYVWRHPFHDSQRVMPPNKSVQPDQPPAGH